jgi:hypothetical protein
LGKLPFAAGTLVGATDGFAMTVVAGFGALADGAPPLNVGFTFGRSALSDDPVVAFGFATFVGTVTVEVPA